VSWALVPLVELPSCEIVPYPDDWNDPRQRERWNRGRADALAIPIEDVVGAGHVRADRPSAEAWRRLLTAQHGRRGLRGDVNLEGGLGLFVDETAVLLPACCSWIDDATEEWGCLVAAPPDEWSMLWIGHPWVLVKRSGDAVAISKPTESIDDEGVEVLAEVPIADLSRAIDHARNVAERAVPHLAEALARRRSAADVARRALGLAGPRRLPGAGPLPTLLAAPWAWLVRRGGGRACELVPDADRPHADQRQRAVGRARRRRSRSG
jgi:hypothetical protein